MKWLLKRAIVVVILCAVIQKVTGVNVGKAVVEMVESFVASVEPAELAMTLKEAGTKVLETLRELFALAAA